MPASRRAGLVSRRPHCRCPPSSRPTARAITATLGPPSPGRPFSPAAFGRRACARVWANQKKDNPMFLSSLLASLSRWLHYRDTVRQLSDLSDRELRDLGIHRGDIHAAAWSGR